MNSSLVPPQSSQSMQSPQSSQLSSSQSATSPYPPGSKAIYSVIERPGKQPYWMKIGIAFVNRDASYSIVLDAYPKDGKLQMRDHAPPRDYVRRDDDVPRFA